VLEAIALPAHLRMNFRVVDDAGRELALGRDLHELRARLGPAAQIALAEAGAGIERGGIRAWDFGDLPQTIAVQRRGAKLVAYPALDDDGDSVSIRVFDTAAAAAAAHRAGVVRLLRLELREPMQALERRAGEQKEALLQLRSLAGAEHWRAEVVAAVAARAFVAGDELPRDRRAYERQRARARARLPAVADAALRLFAEGAAGWAAASAAIARAGSAAARPAADCRAQLARLVTRRFLTETPWERLQHLPRYLKAIELRLAKYRNHPERDDRHTASLTALWQQYEARAAAQRDAPDPRLDDYRWQLEELRVSLYAQELKTPAPVSFKRLQKQWQQLAA
jgi:ATP-dependent helicase HrpA